MLIEIPYSPYELQTRILGPDSTLLSEEQASSYPFCSYQYELYGRETRGQIRRSFKYSRSEGDKLLDVIRQIREQDQTMNIDCRVLKGRERSPVHDRFIAVNDDVYILGSSLNEFGSRATTLFKVPDPNLIINEMESWWQDSQFTISLEEWISN